MPTGEWRHGTAGRRGGWLSARKAALARDDVFFAFTAKGTVEHIEQLFRTAKDRGYDVFISPHYYYPTDHGWRFGGTVANRVRLAEPEPCV